MNAVKILVSLVQFKCIYIFLTLMFVLMYMNKDVLDLNLSPYSTRNIRNAECA